MSFEKIYIENTDEKVAEALERADAYIGSLGLNKKNAIRLRLLAEETLGMVRAMAGDFSALFWIENEDGVYKVKLTAKTEMDKGKKAEFLSVSKSGTNAAVKGFMSKIGEIVENGLLNFEEALRVQQEYEGGTDYGYLSLGMQTGVPLGMNPVMESQFMWSLQNYRNALEDIGQDDDVPVSEAWDELEKSIVANLAEDIIIGVKKDRVDVTIVAKSVAS